jgi:hypothetical protein
MESTEGVFLGIEAVKTSQNISATVFAPLGLG